jgi:hypothetical protein
MNNYPEHVADYINNSGKNIIKVYEGEKQRWWSKTKKKCWKCGGSGVEIKIKRILTEKEKKQRVRAKELKLQKAPKSSRKSNYFT